MNSEIERLAKEALKYEPETGRLAKRHAGEFAFVNRDAIRAKFALSGLKDDAK